MTKKCLHLLICILAILLLLAACKSKQKTTEIPKITETTTAVTNPTETAAARTEPKHIPKDMELSSEEETLPVGNTDFSEEAPATTVPAVPEVTEAPNPYGNGDNNTKDDEL